MEIDSNAERDKVEKLVRELMEGEKGREVKKKVMEWRKLAEEAAGPSGSSSMNLDELVKAVLLPWKNINSRNLELLFDWR